MSNQLPKAIENRFVPEDGQADEVLPGACRSEVAEVMMQDVVGDYDVPEQVPEWTWVAQNACFAHVRNGQDGIWEFFLNLSMQLPDIPERLKPVIADARERACAYLLVHQGT